MIDVTGFRNANHTRSIMAAQRDRALALAALAGWRPGWPEQWRAVAQARAASVAPWADIAAQLGMTKDQAAACFRRLREAAGR